jgi:hypothetical protein
MEHIADISEVLLELGLSDSVTDEERAIATTAIAKAEGAIRRFLGYDPVYQEHTEYYPMRTIGSQRRQGVLEVDGDVAVVRQLSEGATNVLALRHVPLRAVTALYIDYDGRSGARDGAFGSEALKTEGADFWANYDAVDSDGNGVAPDGILNSIGLWPTTPGTVKVVYMAGYTAAELRGQDTIIDASGINDAAVNEAVRRVKRFFAVKKQSRSGFVAGIVTSERLGDYSYSIDAASTAQLLGGGDLTPESKEKLQPFVNMGLGF